MSNKRKRRPSEAPGPATPGGPGPGSPGANDTEEGPAYVFLVNSMYGYRAQKGLVEVVVNGADFSTLMTPAEARDLAFNLLACAEAAEGDAFIMGYMQNRIGVTDPAIKAQILIDFREWRAAQAGAE